MLYLFEDYALDADRRELRRGTSLIPVQPQVLDLLEYLIRNRDRVVSKDDLIAAIWGGRIVSESALSTRINAARTAVGDCGERQRLIRTLPRKGIRFVGTLQEEQRTAPVPASNDAEQPKRVLLDRPSIAVLPFENIGGDPDQEYFANGMVEEIITALSRIRSLFVIASNSTFTYKGQAVDVKRVGRELGVRYVLEGSIRKAGNRLRITGQLIDAVSGAHLWADHFEGVLRDVFELQDMVASAVAGVIEPALLTAERHRSGQRPTSDLTAYDLYLRALSDVLLRQKEGTFHALELLTQAIERDPRYGPALVLAARCHLDLYVGGWTSDPNGSRRNGLTLARKALRVAEDDPYVLAHAAHILGFFGEDIAAALALADRALQLNPSYARGWDRSGWLRLWAGMAETAIEHFETFISLSPRESRAGAYLGIGVGYFFARRLVQAKAMLLQSLQEMSTWPPTYRFLASCCAHMGQLDEARDIIARLRAITPIVIPNAEHWRIIEQRQFYLEGLRLAAETANLQISNS